MGSGQPREPAGGHAGKAMESVPRPAAVYAAAGLIPFLACAALVWILPYPWNAFALDVQLYYGAVVLSFLGAVHWGLAMAGTGAGKEGAAAACTWTRLGWAVAPALVGWLSVIMVPLVGLITQILAFTAAFFGDVRAARLGLAPLWYTRLRRPLTALVLVSLGVALLRVVWRG